MSEGQKISDTEILRLCRDWPGKKYLDEQSAEHPALWHMLDVGAVAQCLLKVRPLMDDGTNQALALLVALHDIGKISNSFRDMLREGKRQQRRHWEHSAIILQGSQFLAESLGGSEEVRHILYEATAGHHGGPREVLAPTYLKQQHREIGEAAFADANLAIHAIVGLFPNASLEKVDEQSAIALSWHLNGLTVQSDWIGSNVDWFAVTEPGKSINECWQRALQGADDAIKKASLHVATPAKPSIEEILSPGVHPHPMQEAVQTCDLPDGPVLGLIEDSTGSGKTEASLILASRMMQMGKADGLFFALPTMATANAMLSRIEDVAVNLFDGKPPTLGLAHGRARLSDDFDRIKGRDGSNPEDGPHCGKWLSDDRRRILLSDVGVGTIDQALFAVLPTRFNGLRLRALSSKVLVVDEAHSYDPYMDAQLERLLTFQARLGGSAIVMTATLPTQKRDRFIKAFQQGLAQPSLSRGTRQPHPEAIPKEQPPYPALTITGKTARLTSVEPAKLAIRRTGVQRLSDPAEAVELIADASSRGAACVWIRNAVDDVIKSVEALNAKGIQADLLHARFAICDRLSKERVLQQRFGKFGGKREGRVLVATQVVEQSLDLDFDVMVSDLAPIGALIQRSGRLWRHMDVRPANTRSVDEPILHILSPDPGKVDSDRWLHSVMEHGAWVYPPTEMWRSAKVIFDAGELNTPSELRGLIDRVENVDPLPVPEVLESREFEYEGQKIVERQLARNSLIEVNMPFVQNVMRQVWDDEKFPTRLGVPQVTLVLACHSDSGLEPYFSTSNETGSTLYRWAMSELQVSWTKFKKLLPDSLQDQDMDACEVEEMLFHRDKDKIDRIKRDWSESRAKYTIVAPMESDGRLCEGLRYDATLGAIWESTM